MYTFITLGQLWEQHKENSLHGKAMSKTRPQAAPSPGSSPLVVMEGRAAALANPLLQLHMAGEAQHWEVQ